MGTTRWVHFRVDERVLERAKKAAEADRRSLSNWVALTVERALAEDTSSDQENHRRVP